MATLADTGRQLKNNSADALQRAKDRAATIATSEDYAQFVESIRKAFPWRFKTPTHELERNYTRTVDHHLAHLIPLVRPYLESGARLVLDFGCGSGGSAIALAMVEPNVRCIGTDIDAGEIAVARDRAKLYHVADRCEFRHVNPGESLPFPDGSFDFSLCSSVLEYAVEEDVRRFCVREMARLVRPGGCYSSRCRIAFTLLKYTLAGGDGITFLHCWEPAQSIPGSGRSEDWPGRQL